MQFSTARNIMVNVGAYRPSKCKDRRFSGACLLLVFVQRPLIDVGSLLSPESDEPLDR